MRIRSIELILFPAPGPTHLVSFLTASASSLSFQRYVVHVRENMHPSFLTDDYFLLFYINGRILHILLIISFTDLFMSKEQASLFFYGYSIFLYVDVTPMLKQITSFRQSGCLQTLPISPSAVLSQNPFLSLKSFLCEY